MAATITPWWERPGNPHAYGVSCLFHPLEEAVEVSSSNVPRCAPCAARHKADRTSVRAPPRELLPQRAIALAISRLPGAIIDATQASLHVEVLPALRCGGDHEIYEPCMNCLSCGACREDLDSEDYCTDCGGKDETTSYETPTLTPVPASPQEGS